MPFGTKNSQVIKKGSGLSVADILANASGKQSGQVTEQDIAALVKHEGITSRDARKIMGGARQFMKSGNSYELNSKGTFNTFDKEGAAKTASSKSAGNKKGFDAGDLIGAGKKVSKFVGFAEMLNNKPKTGSSAPTVNGTPVQNVAKTASEAASPTPSGGQVSSGGRKKTETAVRAQETSGGIPKMLRPNEPVKPIDLIDNKFGIGKNKGNGTVQKQVSKGPGNKWADLGYYGHLAASFNEGVIDLPASILRGPAAMGEMFGLDTSEYQTKALGDMYSDNVTKPLMKKLGGKDESIDDIPTTVATLAPSMLLAGRTGLGKGATKLVGKAANVITKPAKYVAAKAAGAVSTGAKAAVKLETNSGWIPSVAKNIKFPQMEKIWRPAAKTTAKKATSFSGNTKGRDKVIKEMSDQMESGFRNGGKITAAGLMKHRDGGKIIWGTNDAKTTRLLKGDNGLKFKYKNLLDKVRMSSDDATASSTGNYATDTPQIGSTDLFGNGFGQTAGDVASKVAKYALPFIGEALGRRALRKGEPAPFAEGELPVGTVYDMPKPNFHLRYREPVGPDVQSEIAGRKFADAQQTEQTADFDTRNAMSRISQRQAITDRDSRNKMFNLQGRRNYDIYANQQKLQLAGMNASSIVEPFVAAQQHLATDVATGAYLGANKKSLLAEQILRFGTPGSDEYEQAKRYLSGNK